jgi:hypothetical protein
VADAMMAFLSDHAFSVYFFAGFAHHAEKSWLEGS